MDISVVIPSRGRAEVLHGTLLSLLHQALRPKEIVLGVTRLSDVLPQSWALPTVRVILAPPGSTHQRNAAMDATAAENHFIFFCDDDVEFHHRYLDSAVSAFARDRIAVVDGRVVADGARKGGIAPEEARRILHVAGRHWSYKGDIVPVRREKVYGCNMMVARDVAMQCRWDERFRNYGLYDDADFAGQTARYGKLRRALDALCVHLAAPGGRLEPEARGYAQVANALYLAGKGTLPRWYAIKRSAQAVVMNGLRMRSPVYRRQLRGNLRAVLAAARGRALPEHSPFPEPLGGSP